MSVLQTSKMVLYNLITYKQIFELFPVKYDYENLGSLLFFWNLIQL